LEGSNKGKKMEKEFCGYLEETFQVDIINMKGKENGDKKGKERKMGKGRKKDVRKRKGKEK